MDLGNDEAVRDLKRSLAQRDQAHNDGPWTRTSSEPDLKVDRLHPEIGSVRDIAQPGGFRREHIIRNSEELIDHSHPVHRRLLDYFPLNPLIRGSLPGTPRGGSSNFATILVLVKSTIGGTLLILPGGFKDAGMFGGPALLFGLGMLEVYCMVLLVRICEKLRGASYGEIAYAACGRVGTSLVDVSLLLSQVGFVCAEMLYVAKNGRSALNHFGWRKAPSIEALLCFQLILVMPMAQTRKLEYFKTTNFLANLMVLSMLASLLAIATTRLSKDGLPQHLEIVGPKWPVFAGTAVFAFECINFVIPMYEAHTNKKTFVPILVGTLAGVCAMMICFGVVAYSCYGADTKPVLTKNLDPRSLPAKVVPISFAMASLFTVPLILFPAAVLVEDYLLGPGDKSSTWNVKTSGIRAALVAICAMISVIGSESIDAFIAVVGSFCCVPLAFIYPCIFHLRLCKPGVIGATFDVLIATVGLLIFVLTSQMALAELWADNFMSDAEHHTYSYY